MVSPVAIGCLIFGCVFGGALLGIVLRAVLPEHHVSAESKDVVKLGIGLLATMTALVLSLLLASARSSYEMQRNELTQVSANIIVLDRVLALYGPETKDARDLLRRSVARALDRMSPQSGSRAAQLEPGAAGAEGLYDKIQVLSPGSEAQRSLRAEALRIGIDLARTRWLLFEQGGRSIPVPFLVMLVFWVAVIFVSFGLFAPPNATVIATLFVCGLSVSSAIFLILELDQPFEGLVHMSSAPLQNALAHLGR
jgi:hypothetical protein